MIVISSKAVKMVVTFIEGKGRSGPSSVVGGGMNCQRDKLHQSVKAETETIDIRKTILILMNEQFGKKVFKI